MRPRVYRWRHLRQVWWLLPIAVPSGLLAPAGFWVAYLHWRLKVFLAYGVLATFAVLAQVLILPYDTTFGLICVTAFWLLCLAVGAYYARLYLHRLAAAEWASAELPAADPATTAQSGKATGWLAADVARLEQGQRAGGEQSADQALIAARTDRDAVQRLRAWALGSRDGRVRAFTFLALALVIGLVLAVKAGLNVEQTLQLEHPQHCTTPTAGCLLKTSGEVVALRWGGEHHNSPYVTFAAAGARSEVGLYGEGFAGLTPGQTIGTEWWGHTVIGFERGDAWQRTLADPRYNWRVDLLFALLCLSAAVLLIYVVWGAPGGAPSPSPWDERTRTPEELPTTVAGAVHHYHYPEG